MSYKSHELERLLKSMNGSKVSDDKCLTLLSQALLDGSGSGPRCRVEVADFDELLMLATSHHVIVRAFPVLRSWLKSPGSAAATKIDEALRVEHERVGRALTFLAPICQALEETGDVVVIKSLDHWPDLGSDLDLYTNAKNEDVVGLMRGRFRAQLADRSWGDRLANKWNFIVPGLPELVEVHVARLGQTGEQIAITESLIARSRMERFGSYPFRVPAPEDRIVISTLQRMYRHFYIRLCDVVDNSKLIDADVVDYSHLKSLAEEAGLWDGLATYLVVLSDFVRLYRGRALDLPAVVVEAARFGNELVHLRKKFLRIPIFPQAMGLYASEWKRLFLNGEWRSTLRLSLLPALATAAALEFKMTGSDKGVW